MTIASFKELTDPLRGDKGELLSAIMPVYNSEKFLVETIQSVLGQTFSDFEFIILDDGSTDNSLSIIMQYANSDERIRVVSCEHNIGLVQIRNLGLELANCDLFATIDSDDISLPTRFSVQVSFMQQHPYYVAAGANCSLITAHGDPLMTDALPTDHDQIYARLLKGDGGIIRQPAAIHRTKIVREIGGYRCAGAEDLDLYLRLAEVGKLANIPEVLVLYRQHLSSSNYSCWERNFNARNQAIADAYMRIQGNVPENIELLPYEKPNTTILLEGWGWASLKNKNIKVARNIAKHLFMKQPFSLRTWRFLCCALRGY
jgi:glycosyltransferase involved in cell wall biosynthesis